MYHIMLALPNDQVHRLDIIILICFCCSVAQSCPTLQPHGLQHTRLPCPSPSPGACSNPCPLSQWCHPTMSSSVISFSSCLQSFPSSGSFPMSRLFTSGGQSTGASATASVLPVNILVWSPCSPSDSQESSSTPQFKSIKSSGFNLLYGPTFTSIYDYWKTIALTRWTFVGKVMSLLFNMLFRFVITFLPRSKHLLISWLQSPSAVILSVGKSVVSCGFFIDVLCQIGEITFYF